MKSRTAFRGRRTPRAEPDATPSACVINCLSKMCVIVAVGGLLAALALTATATRADNVNWGPFHLTVSARAGAEYTDNVNNSSDKPKSDFRLTLGPTVDGGIALGPNLPGGEELLLSVGANWSAAYSTKDGKITESFSNPAGATASLPFYFLLGRWRVQFLETFTYSTSVLETTYGANRQSITHFENVASVSAIRPFGRVSLTLSAQRLDDITPEDSELTQTQYTVTVQPAYAINEFVSVFWGNSYFRNDIQNPSTRDSQGFSSQVGVNGQITPSISGTASISWSHVELQPGQTTLFGGIFDGIYLHSTNGVDHIDGISSTVALNYVHPLRPGTTHSIALFRSPGLTAVVPGSDITAVTGVSYNINHQLTRQVTLRPHVSYTHLESLSGSKEKTDLIIFGFELDRQFGKQFSGHMGYRYQSRDSNIKTDSYDVNQVNAGLTYTF